MNPMENSSEVFFVIIEQKTSQTSLDYGFGVAEYFC